MKFAFIIFKYFPYGGVQRDMLRIAQDCVALGHSVTILTGEWQGVMPADIQVELFARQGWLNHQKQHHLIVAIQRHIQHVPFDLVVGFNRMPGLDVYFAADSCFVAKAHQDKPWWYRLTPRYRWFANTEAAVFNAEQRTHILTLTQAEQATFQQWYATPDSRFHLIPPFLSAERFAKATQQTDAGRDAIRQQVRAIFGFQPDDYILLLVGSGFKTKGADRMVLAMSRLTASQRAQTRALIIGQDNGRQLRRQLDTLGLTPQVTILRGSDDIPLMMQAADVLVHPARRELAGHVLLEAMACGLPVLTTDQCGYALHVQQANAGLVLPSPFEQEALDRALAYLLTSETATYRQAGMVYAQTLMQENPGGAEARIIHQLGLSIPKPELVDEDNGGPSFSSHHSDVMVSDAHRLALKDLSFSDVMSLQGDVARATANRNTVRVTIAGHGYFVKQHEGVGWREIFKNLVSLKWPILGAMTEVKAIQALNKIGIPTTPLVAYGQRGWNPARLQSFVMTEDLGDIVSLEEVCADWEKQPPDKAFRHAVIVEVAKMAAKLHGAGLCHRDFYLCHFVLHKQALATGQWQLILIDLHRMRMHHKADGQAVMRDIAGLYFSAMDCGLNKDDIALFKRHYSPQSARFWAQVCRRAKRLYTKFNSAKFQQRIQQEQHAIRARVVDE